jgi:hypothetical protein
MVRNVLNGLRFAHSSTTTPEVTRSVLGRERRMRKRALLLCLFGVMLLSTPATAESFKLAAAGNCDDRTHGVCLGQELSGHLSNVLSLGENRNPFGPMHLYLELAWLSAQYDAHPKATRDINLAALAIVNPSVIHSNFWNSGADKWLGLAHNHDYSDFDSDRVVVINFSDVSPARRTEEQMMETPEPGSLILLGSGLAGIFWRRRRP